MEWVFDASVTMAWCFEDERTEHGRSLLHRLASSPAVVPQLWPLEVGNVLLLALRRKRISRAEMLQFLSLLKTGNIHVDTRTAAHAFDATLMLAEQYSLTVYDAAYLELAIRLQLPLATLDTALQEAARKAGVALL